MAPVPGTTTPRKLIKQVNEQGSTVKQGAEVPVIHERRNTRL